MTRSSEIVFAALLSIFMMSWISSPAIGATSCPNGGSHQENGHACCPRDMCPDGCGGGGCGSGSNQFPGLCCSSLIAKQGLPCDITNTAPCLLIDEPDVYMSLTSGSPPTLDLTLNGSSPQNGLIQLDSSGNVTVCSVGTIDTILFGKNTSSSDFTVTGISLYDPIDDDCPAGSASSLCFPSGASHEGGEIVYNMLSPGSTFAVVDNSSKEPAGHSVCYSIRYEYNQTPYCYDPKITNDNPSPPPPEPQAQPHRRLIRFRVADESGTCPSES